ncbi:hypothetical protein BC628DRAFT_1312414 [Trametes gibbosa]|nr:hypothetical protein BC628DRAFT_1312414 [Trametes gibbosa]
MALLHADILATIVAFAPLEAISPMMRASRFFYHEGPKALLRHGVGLDTDETVAKFIRFINAEGGTRSRYVTELYIIFDEYDEGTVMSESSAELLSGLLRTLTFDRLTTLHIDRCETTLVAYPSLLTALKGLPDVRDIALDSCGKRACDLVSGLGGHLRHAMLIYSVEEPIGAAPVQDIHPLTTLRSSHDTLTKLDVHFMDEHLPRSLYPPPFPNVREFEIAWCHYPLLSPYIHALPNLRTLSFITTFDMEDASSAVVLAPHREGNRLEQLQYGSWKSLDYVYGRVADLYISGLTCQVRHLSLHMVEETFEMLSNVVEDTRPSDLSLHTMRAGAFDNASGVPAILRQAGAAKLEVFKWDVQLDPEDKDLNLISASTDLVSCMRPLSLRKLELVFTCFDFADQIRERVRLGPTLPQSEVEKFLGALDLANLGAQFLSSIPTLELVTLEICGHRVRKHERVVVSSEGTTVTTRGDDDDDDDSHYD